MQQYKTTIDGMANGHAVEFSRVFGSESMAIEWGKRIATPRPRWRVAYYVAPVGGRVTHTNAITKGDTMSTNYIDNETLAIAKLVASAEGISLNQAIAEELALWEGVSMACHVCGTSLFSVRYKIGPGQYVCLDCETTKGQWEDMRLDDYSRLI